MARVMTKVNREVLAQAIQEAEKDGPLKNLNELWKAAAEIYNRSASEEFPAITHSVVYLRARDFGLSYQTKAGKKGRGAGVPMDPEQKRKMQEARAAAKAAGLGTRKSKFRNHPGREASRQAQLEQLRINGAQRFAPLVELAVDGNRKAADKLFCLGCVGYATAEVRRCSDIGCSKWLGRPFQKIAENASAEELEAAEQAEMVETDELEAVA